MLVLPPHVQPWFLASGLLLVAASLCLRRELVLQGSAAMAVLTMLSPESQINRCGAFALAVLIAAPASGVTRAAAFVSTCLAYWAFRERWAVGVSPLLLAGVHAPIAMAIWLALRKEASKQASPRDLLRASEQPDATTACGASRSHP